MRLHLLSLLLLLCCINSSSGFFGGKKEKDDDNSIGAKESVALGVDMMMKAASDPATLKDAMSMLDDPATRKEVEKMMADPAFKKEMEKMKSNPVYMNAIQGAKDMLDPQRAANIQSQMSAHESSGLTDAALGMQEMMKASKNPKMLADAMEMMKDPEIAAEVAVKFDSVSTFVCIFKWHTL